MTSTPQTPLVSVWSIDSDTDYDSPPPLRYFEYPSVTESTNPNSSSDSLSISVSFVDTIGDTNNIEIPDPLDGDHYSMYMSDSYAYITSHTNYTPTKTPKLDTVPEDMNRRKTDSQGQSQHLRTIPAKSQA